LTQLLAVVALVPAGVWSDYALRGCEAKQTGTIRHLRAEHVRPCEIKYLTEGDQER
jgi:hypothetical protein